MQCDLPSETNQQTMDDFCKDNSFLGYFPTSAKEDIGIGDAARGLVAEVCRVAHHECHGIHNVQVMQINALSHRDVATALIMLYCLHHFHLLQILKREEIVGGGIEDDKEDHVRLQDPVIKRNSGGCCRKS